MLKPISALEALRAIDAELHMVTKYGPEVGQSYDSISAEHVHTAKTMLETLIAAQKAEPTTPHDHAMEPSEQGEWVRFEDVKGSA